MKQCKITIELDINLENVESLEMEQQLIYEYLQELIQDETLNYTLEEYQNETI